MERKLRNVLKIAKKLNPQKSNKVLFLSGLFAFLFLVFPSGKVYSQLDCEAIDAGPDVTVDCGEQNVLLEASVMVYLNAQTTSYVIAEPDCPLPPISGGDPTNLTIDDVWSGVIDIPFEFSYFGNDYGELVVGANGQISFDTSLAGDYNGWGINPGDLLPMTSANFPLNTIYGAFHDMNPATNPQPDRINYFVSGTAPFRTFVLNFNEVPHFSCSDLSTTQQIVLYETLNIIEINLIDKPICSGWNDGLATMGIMGNNVGEFAVEDSRNTGVWEATDETWRFIPDGDVEVVTTIEWTDENGTVLGDQFDITVSPAQTTTYTFSITYEYPDGTTTTGSDTVTVTVDGPSFTVDLGSDQFLCDETSYEIVSEIVGADPQDATYEWFLDGVSLGVDAPNYTATTSGEYMVEATILNCTNSDTVIVELNESPIIELGDNFETCFENQIFLNAAPANYDLSDATFQWTLNGNTLPDTGHEIEAMEYGTYGVTVFAAGCTAQDEITISPRGDLIVSLSAPPSSCTEEVITITASTEEEGVAYTWYVNGDELPGETSASIEVTTPSEASNMPEVYKVEITKGDCYGSAEIEIYSLKCGITQGISPGGSIGQNDNLDLEFIANRTGIEKIQIFNRSGSLVYEKQNYVNEWEGQSMDGHELPTGTYFYTINFSVEDPEFGSETNGWIYINRAAN